jgi:hypothetical protein
VRKGHPAPWRPFSWKIPGKGEWAGQGDEICVWAGVSGEPCPPAMDGVGGGGRDGKGKGAFFGGCITTLVRCRRGGVGKGASFEGQISSLPRREEGVGKGASLEGA